MQDSDDSNEHQQQSPPRPTTSKKLTGAATYRTKLSSVWVSHYRVLFEVERSETCSHALTWSWTQRVSASTRDRARVRQYFSRIKMVDPTIV